MLDPLRQSSDSPIRCGADTLTAVCRIGTRRVMQHNAVGYGKSAPRLNIILAAAHNRARHMSKPPLGPPYSTGLFLPTSRRFHLRKRFNELPSPGIRLPILGIWLPILGIWLFV